jgi:hypothetical protein
VLVIYVYGNVFINIFWEMSSRFLFVGTDVRKVLLEGGQSKKFMTCLNVQSKPSKLRTRGFILHQFHTCVVYDHKDSLNELYISELINAIF